MNQDSNSNLEDNNLEDKDLGNEIDVVRSKYGNRKVTLEQFLAKLWLLSETYCEREWITGGEFLAMLDTAYGSAEPQTQSPQPPKEVGQFGFKGWQSTILEQIYDLYDLAKRGPFSDGLRAQVDNTGTTSMSIYFGSAPTAARSATKLSMTNYRGHF